MVFDFFQSDAYKMLNLSLSQIIESTEETGLIIESVDGKLHDKLSDPICVNMLKFTPNNFTHFSYLSPQKHLANIIIQEKENAFHYNDYIQVSFIIKGKVYISMGDKEECFCENEFLLIDTSCYHRYVLEKSDGVIIYIGISPELFTETILANIEKNTLQYFIRDNLLGVKNKQLYIRYRPAAKTDDKKLSDYFSSVYFEIRSELPGYDYMIKGHLIRLFDFIANNYNHSYTDEQKNSYRKLLFQEVEIYMINHCATCKMQDLIASFHYQTNYLNKLIKEFTGMSYSRFLIFLKITKAKRLLLSTNNNIDNIITSVGYNNKGFFYKVFLENTGMTPSDYRNKHRMYCD